MKFYMMVTVAAVLLLAGCGNDDDEIADFSETYFGRYYSGNVGVAMPPIDSVELSIVNRSYTLFIVERIRGQGGTICSSIGEITGFPGLHVRFEPDTVLVGNCDSLRVPNGTFTARYAGNSVIMNAIDTITYQIQRNGILVTDTAEIELLFELTR